MSEPQGKGKVNEGKDSKSSISIEEFQTEFKENLSKHMVFHLIPDSGKVVVFDSTLPVRHALNGMLDNDIQAAPVYDSNTRKFIGMLTVSDLIHILLKLHSEESGTSTPILTSLETHRICDWQEIKKRNKERQMID